MYTVRDLALRNVCKETGSQLQLQQVQALLGASSERSRALVAALIYLQLTEAYSPDEKNQIISYLANSDKNKAFASLSQNEALYQRMIVDGMLTAVQSSLSMLPIYEKGCKGLKYESVGTNNSQAIEAGKSYGHHEYYQCVIALITTSESGLHFYHFNPRRLYPNEPDSLFADNSRTQMQLVDIASSTVRHHIFFILHARSILQESELNALGNHNIKEIRLPTGSESIALSYDGRIDQLTVNNLEGNTTFIYDDIRDRPVKPVNVSDPFVPKDYFLRLMNYGDTWENALKETLEIYIIKRGYWSKYTRPLSEGLFHNPQKTAANIAAAQLMKNQLESNNNLEIPEGISKGGELSQLMEIVQQYQSAYTELKAKTDEYLAQVNVAAPASASLTRVPT